MLETTKPICTEKELFKVIYPQEGKRDIVAFHCCVISGRVHSLILLVKAALMTLSNCPWVSPPTKTYLLRIEYCVFYIRIQIHQHYCYAQNLSNHLFPRALTSQQTYLAISGQMRKPNDLIVLHN